MTPADLFHRERNSLAATRQIGACVTTASEIGALLEILALLSLMILMFIGGSSTSSVSSRSPQEIIVVCCCVRLGCAEFHMQSHLLVGMSEHFTELLFAFSSRVEHGKCWSVHRHDSSQDLDTHKSRRARHARAFHLARDEIRYVGIVEDGLVLVVRHLVHFVALDVRDRVVFIILRVLLLLLAQRDQVDLLDESTVDLNEQIRHTATNCRVDHLLR